MLIKKKNSVSREIAYRFYLMSKLVDKKLIKNLIKLTNWIVIRKVRSFHRQKRNIEISKSYENGAYIAE